MEQPTIDELAESFVNGNLSHVVNEVTSGDSITVAEFKAFAKEAI